MADCRRLAQRLVALAGKRENAAARILKLLADEHARLPELQTQIEEEIKTLPALKQEWHARAKRHAASSSQGKLPLTPPGVRVSHPAVLGWLV